MELISRYGMEFNPFLKNSRDFFFEGNEFKEAKVRLDTLTRVKGFGLLTGAAGRGKTTLIRSWTSGLNPALYKVVYSSLSTLTVSDFYIHLASSLGAQPAFRKVDNFRIIQNEITRYALDRRQTPVIIIDEANYVKNAILNDLKLLFNFEMDSRDRAIVLLAGLPQLNNTLQLSIHEPFRQRIIMNYHLEGFSKEESRSYIEWKLKKAGCMDPVFDAPAIEAIVNASGGTPRVINKLCHTALVIGHSRAANRINSDIAMQAVNECTLG